MSRLAKTCYNSIFRLNPEAEEKQIEAERERGDRAGTVLTGSEEARGKTGAMRSALIEASMW